MRFGVREICDVVFRPLAAIDLGGTHFKAGQPCLWMDTAKTSTLEGAATTVYAQGGQGNPRLIAWEGEKTLTFTIEDALLSDVSLSMLTGAGLMEVGTGKDVEKTYEHITLEGIIEKSGTGESATYTVDITGALKAALKKNADLESADLAKIQQDNNMPIYGVVLDEAGAAHKYYTQALTKPASVGTDKTVKITLSEANEKDAGKVIRIDCYIERVQGKIINIEAAKFAGYYYIEANTLFRDEATGQDFPAEFVIPRGKIQSNFTFTMAASGDPSTFTFTIDAFPAYTKFDLQTTGDVPKKVLAAIQVFDDQIAKAEDEKHYENLA